MPAPRPTASTRRAAGGDWPAIAAARRGDRDRRHPQRHRPTPSVIAELREIEEIRINGVDPSGPSGTAGGDNFEIIGDFSGTSLRLNTITIDGEAGDDTVDISALTSAHRIVFSSNGGNDTIVGTLRPQDVIELPDGADAGGLHDHDRRTASPR